MSDLALLCEPVARIVWGKPSFETARELRWGTRGSRVVDRAKGVWHDHEHNVGGGALDLVPGATKPEQLQWLRDRGLISDAPSVASKNGNRSGAPPIIVATYDYTDESGASLFQVVRFDPKYFRQRRRDGNGGWSWSLSNARRVLYRLPELKDAVMSCRWVLIVEGEKDVDNLRKLGFAATCNPGGANKWRAEYSESLRGADVVIIGDNDDSGRLHAARVASSLQGIALRVRVLDLAKAWPACPPKGDISDWIEAGGTAEALAALIEALPDWAPTEDEKRRREQQARNGANGHDETEIVQLEIRRLAKLPLVEYDRERVSAAQGLGVRTSVLDRLVDAERKKSGDNNKQGQALMLPEPERWPERVEGEALLSELSLAIRRHVVLPKHSADAAALWAVHTYALEAVSITPRLAITSPEKQCGKTTLLDVIRCLVWRPLETANATGPSVFRAVELARPCLLVDEADTFLADNAELRGILNSGHRRGGSVLRTVGDDHEPRQFSTYAACAIAMIGKLPGTLADRSIAIQLQRRLPGESIEPFRLDRVEHLDQLASKAARWAADNLDRVRAAEPDMPSGSFNRVADNWRPLLAIADVAGGEWPQRARVALASIRATVEDDARRVMLLADIRSIFVEREVDRLPSAELVKALVAWEGRPWAEMPKTSKALTPNGLARLLKDFRIRPDGIRVGNETPNGYRLEQFTDIFERYLSPLEGTKAPHLHKCDEMGTSELFPTSTSEPRVEVGKREKSNNDGLCGGVEVENGGPATIEASTRLCDHCGGPAAPAEPLHPWDWPGWPDGIWLHTRCEEDWLKAKRLGTKTNGDTTPADG